MGATTSSEDPQWSYDGIDVGTYWERSKKIMNLKNNILQLFA